MTHGEQTKAKAAKTSQASGKSSSKEAGGKAVQSGKSGKGSPKEAGETGKAAKILVKKDQTSAAAQKGSGAKEAGNGAKTGSSKARPAAEAPDAAPGFSNPTVANAFKRAVKKYPNAFRKLTD